MRVGLFLVGLVLGVPAGVRAQPDRVLYTATVSQVEATAHCLPSDVGQSYPTNTLKSGTVVQVVEQLGDGWLRILPPAGSFSYINKRFLTQPTTNQPTHVVVAAAGVGVPVYVGSDHPKQNRRPTKEGAKLPRGAIVVAVGPSVVDEDGAWLRIEPPPGEYRFIRAAAVTRNNGPVPTQAGTSPFNPARPETTVAASPNPEQPLAVPGAGTPAQPAAGANQRARLQQLQNQAEQAERERRYADAIQLYTQVGTEGVVVDQDLALRALNRAYMLRQSTGGQSVTGQPTRPTPGSGATMPSRLPEPAQGSQFTPATGGNSTPATTANRPDSNGGYAYSTGLGVLYPSSLRVLEGRKTYLMMTRSNQPIAYVTPGPGVNLEPYLNREVELTGRAVYRGDLKTNLMVVERVTPGR